MLRELKKKDAKFMLEWMHDSNVSEVFDKDFSSFTTEDVISFISHNKKDDKNHHFAIVDENDEYLGTISLKNVSEDDNAEYAIVLRSKAHGLGIAKKASNELLEIGFDQLKLEKIYLNVLATNPRAIRFYEKMGFKKEGIARKHKKHNQQYVDLLWFGMLKEEYKA